MLSKIFKENKAVIVLALLSLIFRFSIINIFTYPYDMPWWVEWSARLVNGGFGNFYNNWSDYLPSYLYILWFIGKIKIFFVALGINLSDNLLFKTPSILADIGAASIIYSLIKKYIGKKSAVWAFCLYAFNPAIITNSTIWGQVDGFQAFFLILTFYLFWENKLYIKSVIAAFAIFIKPTSLLIAPVLILNLLNSKNTREASANNIKTDIINLTKKYQQIISELLIFIITVFLIFIPFTKNKPILNFIAERYEFTINQYPYASVSAFNLWAFVGKLSHDDLNEKFMQIPFYYWGIIVFAIILTTSLYFLYKNQAAGEKEKLFLTALTLAIIFAGSFNLLTRIHERHLLIALPFMAMLAVVKKRFLIAYFAASIIYIINLSFFFIQMPEKTKEIYIFLFSGINIVILLFIFSTLITYKKHNPLTN